MSLALLLAAPLVYSHGGDPSDGFPSAFPRLEHGQPLPELALRDLEDRPWELAPWEPWHQTLRAFVDLQRPESWEIVTTLRTLAAARDLATMRAVVVVLGKPEEAALRRLDRVQVQRLHYVSTERSTLQRLGISHAPATCLMDAEGGLQRSFLGWGAGLDLELRAEAADLHDAHEDPEQARRRRTARELEWNATVLERWGDRDHALTLRQARLGLDPDSVEAGRELGRLLVRCTRGAEAVDVLRASLAGTSSEETRAWLARALLDSGREAELDSVPGATGCAEPRFLWALAERAARGGPTADTLALYERAVAAALARPEPGWPGDEGAILSLPARGDGSTVVPRRHEPGLRATLLVFWSPGDAAGEELLAFLQRRVAKLRANGIEIFAVAVPAGPGVAGLEDRLADRELACDVLLDPGLEASAAYAIWTTPTGVLLDGDGRIQARFTGASAGEIERLRLTLDETVARHSPNVARPEEDRRRPEDARRHLRLARVLASRGRSEQAEFTLRLALDEDPWLEEARYALARTLADGGRSVEARELMAHAPQPVPSASWPLLESALLLATGDLVAAEAAAGRAADAPGAGLALARVRVARGESAEAARLLRGGLALQPLDPRAWHELARLSASTDPGAARTAYETALSLLLPGWKTP